MVAYKTLHALPPPLPHKPYLSDLMFNYLPYLILLQVYQSSYLFLEYKCVLTLRSLYL